MPAKIREIALPGALSPRVTITENSVTYHEPAREYPDTVWQALAAWQAIRDDEEADRVARNIIEAIEQAGLK